jgi:protein O-GlcNAc transferase
VAAGPGRCVADGTSAHEGGGVDGAIVQAIGAAHGPGAAPAAIIGRRVRPSRARRIRSDMTAPVPPPSPLAAALALFQAGQAQAARAALQGIVAGAPGDAAAWHLLGLAEHALGRLQPALAALDQAARLGARAPGQLANHAGVLVAAGGHAQALALAEQALAQQPGLAAAQINAGLAAAALGRHAPAAAWLEAGLAQRPLARPARIAAVQARLALQQPAAALALALHPDLLADLPAARAVLGRFPLRDPQRTRLALLRALVAAHPDDTASAYDLAAAWHLAGLGGEAVPAARRVLAAEPDNADAALMLGTGLFERGEVEAGLDVLRNLLERQPDHDLAWATWLVGSHYHPGLDQAALHAGHQRWARARLAGIQARDPAALVHAPDPDRPLRIGWLSPRLVAGAIQQYFEGVLPAFAPGTAEHLVYHDRPDADAATDRLRAQAAAWREVAALDDDVLERQLLADRLDVLVDLAGHAPNNRLRLLARRVAPIQTTWLDYMDTTPVPAIDFLIMDAAIAPPGSERWLDRPVLRLEPCRQAFAPPVAGADPSWAGAADAPFTLACCNRMPKRHAGMFDRYAAVLAALPDARLLLLDAAFEGPATRAHVERWLVERGVDLARVELLGRQSHAGLLEVYRRVDAVLDPYPYSGCTTTCDALWMGVPVLGTPGDTFYSRQSAMFVRAIGRPDWLCPDQDALVAALRALAADPDRRGPGRTALRAAMQATCCDPRPVVAGLAAHLRALWRRRCTEARTRPAPDPP